MRHAFINVLVIGAGVITLVAAAMHGDHAASKGGPSAAERLQRGKYLVKIAGCNDCHTAGYAPAAGKMPESAWLMGDTLGWRGPWGTTYATNLRLYMANLSEAQWIQRAKTVETRPPMPWFILRDMTNEDLAAIYHYVRSLGAAGEPAPAYVPAGKEPGTPYVMFPAPPK
jgi:mono/diheme cytochrome c family protein